MAVLSISRFFSSLRLLPVRACDPRTVPLAAALLALSAFGASPVESYAQATGAPGGVVAGEIQDTDDAPISFANVQLLAAADSSLVRGTLADENGRFLLERVRPGQYVLYVSLIGYRPHLSGVIRIAGPGRHDVPTVVLAIENLEMDGLTVEARRALYEQKGNRLVVNVAASVTAAGATALDVLKRSPGVQVNEQSGTISMLGKDGVRVMIDGKLTYMPPEALLSYLAGLSADVIERIEIISSPPAGMDAEGSAGFVDIVLKQSPGQGLNGSVAVSGGYGEGEVTNGSGSVDYRNGPLRLAGSYSFLWNGQLQRLSNHRWVDEPSAFLETATLSRRDRVQRNHNARLALDLDVADGTTVGAVVGGYDNRWSMDAVNRLSIDADGRPFTRTDSDNEEVNHWQHLMGNVNLRHRFAGGHALTVDLDHLRYHNDNPTVYRNTTTDAETGVVQNDVFDSGKVTPLRLLVGRVDYTAASSEAWTVETGVKGSFSRLENDPMFASLVKDEWIGSEGAAGRTELREDVLAAYAAATYVVNETHTLEAGFRYEHTDSELDDGAGPPIVDRRLGHLFPNATYTLTLSENATGSLSYARRITRPSFNDMAPFLYFIDPLTFFTGNTALQAAVFHSVKVDASYRSVLASLQYTWEDNSIARFQSRVVPGENVQILSPVNYPGTRTLTALTAVPVSVTDWWNVQNDVTALWTEVATTPGDAAGTYRQTSVFLNTTHNLTLPWMLSFEAAGYYRSAARFGTTRVGSDWGVNVGLKRTLWSGAGSLTFGVDNLFDTGDWTFYNAGDGTSSSRAVLDFRHRTVRLSLTRRFGDGAGANPRDTASADESRRVE